MYKKVTNFYLTSVLKFSRDLIFSKISDIFIKTYSKFENMQKS